MGFSEVVMASSNEGHLLPPVPEQDQDQDQEREQEQAQIQAQRQERQNQQQRQEPPSTPPHPLSMPNNQTSSQSHVFLPTQPHSEARFQLQPSPPESPTLDTSSPKIETTMAVRRSARAKKTQGRPLRDPDSEDEFQAPPSPTAGRKRQYQQNNRHKEESKAIRGRPPKRKAAEDPLPPSATDIPEGILEDSLAPIKPEERDEWAHWVEIESDPAFFTFILRELGAKDTKVQEVFGLEEAFLGMYPKPVYGLVFLYQYFDEDHSDDRLDCPDCVWFANQTTDNACGTVALLNIVMNSGIELGDELEDFRGSTKDLCPPLRGWSLSKNSFIRNIHNSFTTRNDFLNAELTLENKYEKASKRRKVNNSKSKATKKTKKVDPDNGYHFIAYVPIDGSVWELDGMQTKPLCIGDYDPVKTDWTTVARPTIEARMAENDFSDLSFNLLALCRAPQAAVRSELASNIKALDAFGELSHPNLKGMVPEDKPWISATDEEDLQDFDLTPAAIADAELPAGFEAKLKRLNDTLATCPDRSLDTTTLSSIIDLRESLETEHRRLKVEYSSEVAAAMEDDARVTGRKKDFGPAIHLWTRKLAEEGALQEIVEEVSA